jgi:predicted dehydrogenase
MGQKQVKLAVIGIGNMGSSHVRHARELANVELAAVCDIEKDVADKYAKEHGVPAYYNYKEVLKDSNVNAVMIATPHYDHTPIAVDAFKQGIHVLTEKPIAVHVNDAKRMIDAYTDAKKQKDDLVFGIMYNQRTHGDWKKVKDLIDGGELGKLVRATWIITTWFRTQTYYNSGGWRATWSGEGGGVLLNQCPHNLDLYQWFVGRPSRVAGFVSIGKYHDIEVEDEVTGYFEYENGMVGHFITTTAESPGTNRLEIVGEGGKLVVEGGKILFARNRTSMLDVLDNSPKSFTKVESWDIDVPLAQQGGAHKEILGNFADAILTGSELIAPGVEGIAGLEIGNAIMLSSFQGRPVDLPLDGDAYENRLKELIAQSKFQKKTTETKPDDFEKSFG